MIEKLIWISIGVIGYTYFGYPILLWFWSLFSKKSPSGEYSPTAKVTVLISARNEQDCIEKTIVSVLESDYPEELLDVLVVSDGSTDRTAEIISSISRSRVHLIQWPESRGKMAAQAAAYPETQGDILVMADASSIFKEESIRKLVRHFSDRRVGSVVGRKTILKTGNDVSGGDGLYWKYESKLRHLESQTGSSWVGCEGGIFAIRKNLFRLDYPPEIAQDYSVCCRVMEQGYINRYEPEAVIYEAPSKDMGVEFSRKIRVIVRGIQAFFAFAYLLNPIKHPAFFLQNMSHRLMRWLVPFFLVALFVASFLSSHPLSVHLFFGQMLFYELALAGLMLKYAGFKFRPATVPLYFCVVNAAGLVSWFMLFKKFGTWTPTSREQMSA